MRGFFKNWKIPAIILPLSCMALFIVNTNQYQAGNIIPDIVWISSILLIVISIIWLLKSFSWKGLKLDISAKLKNWKIPLAILILLILAMFFRWGDLASKTTDTSILKYKIDHWNGSVFMQQITPNYIREIRIKSPYINAEWYYSQGLTIIWSVAMGANIIWLLYALSKIKKKEIEDEGVI